MQNYRAGDKICLFGVWASTLFASVKATKLTEMIAARCHNPHFLDQDSLVAPTPHGP